MSPLLRTSLAAVAIAVVAAGCGSGGASVGDTCATVADCASGLQCLDHTCVPACLANVDCGDGRVCEDGECRLVTSSIGDACGAEAACGPAQTCRLPVDTFVANVGSCQPEPGDGGVVGSSCITDADCRAGACALGRCTELCVTDAQCLRGFVCIGIPRVSSDASRFLGGFRGCMPSRATLVFEVPLRDDATQDVVLPVVDTATSVTLVAEAGVDNDRIGVTRVITPDNVTIETDPATDEEFLAAALRHRPMPGVSVLQIPTTRAVPLMAGAYTMTLVTRNDTGPVTLAERRVRVLEKLGKGATLDLHFHFSDLADHPCLPDGRRLDAATAVDDPAFQAEYLRRLRDILTPANLAIGAITYDRTVAPPDLAGLPVTRAGELFATSTYSTGVSVFLVRTLSPAGLEAWVSATPGAPLPSTATSGVAVAVSALCNDPSWERLARITAHAIARQLGLYRNQEPGTTIGDPLGSPATEDNLMHWDDHGGVILTTDQANILRASGALR